jgi:hypothetical protein
MQEEVKMALFTFVVGAVVIIIGMIYNERNNY